MPKYIVDKNIDEYGYNRVHRDSCNLCHYIKHTVDLGWQIGDAQAIELANMLGFVAMRCNHCCSDGLDL